MHSQDLKKIVEALESKRLGHPVVLNQKEFEASLQKLKELGFIEEYSPVVSISRIFDMLKADSCIAFHVSERLKSGVSCNIGECFVLDSGHVIIDNALDGSNRETWIESTKTFKAKQYRVEDQ